MGEPNEHHRGEAESERLLRGLLDPDAYPHETTDIELVETHISWVLLTGRYVYKLKKPLKLPFLDFSTLEQRRHYCNEELRLNRRHAPELYLDVVPVGGSLDAPRIGEAPPIDYAVKLRQFDRDASADRLLARGRLDRDAICRFAETLAAFHRDLPAVEGRDPGTLALENIDELDRDLREAGLEEPMGELRAWTEARAAELGPVFEARRRAGAVRDGHGDLHLENLVRVDGELRPFDALEFDPALRAVDVIDEAAFVAMDLMAHERTDLAFAFLNRYLEITGDYAGTRVLPFYLLYRALVRAKVRAIKAAQPHAERGVADSVRPYLAVARELAAPRTPLLILTHGLSASGKTTVTDALIPHLPALRIRSDFERKRLHGVAPETHEALGVGQGRYSEAASDKTYAALQAGAAQALAAGLNVIADATFLTRRRREPFRALAGRCGARVLVLDCTAPEPTLRRRIRERAAAGSDPSEATEAVLDAQLRHAEPPEGTEADAVVRVDTSAPLNADALAAELTRAVTRRTRRDSPSDDPEDRDR